MASFLSIPLEIAEQIGAELLACPARLEHLKNLCSLNSKARTIYQKILFRHVSTKSPDQARALAYAVTTNPTLALEVKRMDFLISNRFRLGESYLDSIVLKKARTLEFWSWHWESNLRDNSPFAFCGLLMALLPNLKELEVRDSKVTTSKTGPEHQHLLWLLCDLTGCDILYFSPSKIAPENLPQMENLHTWRSDLLPAFSLQLPSLETVELDVEDYENPLHSGLNNAIPDSAPAFDTIKHVIIKNVLENYDSFDPDSEDVCIKKLLKKLRRVQTIKVVLRTAQQIPELWIRDKDIRKQVRARLVSIDLSALSGMLTGSASSLVVELSPYVHTKYPVPPFVSNFLPDLRLTKNVELPEILLLSDKKTQPRTTVLDHPNCAKVFQMETLKITNATEASHQLLQTLLRLRDSHFFRLRELTISYIPDEDSRPNGKNGAKASRDMHQDLCRDLQKAGVLVTQVFGAVPVSEDE